MAADIYLAMTAAEISSTQSLPPKIGWMACCFSPTGQGLSNLPAALPAGSLLILNDSIPFSGHDPRKITDQLLQALETLGSSGILLDFQVPGSSAIYDLAAHLVSALPCPVAVSDRYAANLSCPVFLSPCPHHTPLQEYFAPWKDRKIWLDLAADAETLTLTSKGADVLPFPPGEIPDGGHRDEELHCHYAIETNENTARFTLWRTKKDLEELALEADRLGVEILAGLYQELHCSNTEKHPSL